MNWEEVKVKDICKFHYGKSLQKDKRNGEEYPVYGSAGRIGYNSDYIVKGPGLIVGRKGSVGNLFYEKDNFYPIDTVFYVEPLDVIDLRYMFYAFHIIGFDKLNSDAAVPGLNRNIAYEQVIPLPPLPIQLKIAGILSAYDDLIENNLKRIKLLEEQAKLYFQYYFNDFQFGDKLPENLPKGWVIKTIGEVYSKLESGRRPKGGIDKELVDGIPSIGAENVIGLGKYNYNNEKLITESFYEAMNRGKIENRDILIYKDGAYIGRTTLFQDNFPHEKCCVNEHVFLLRCKDDRYQYYLFFTLNQKLYFEKMQQLNANAAQPGLNQESLKSLKILWPEENKVVEYNHKIENLVKTIFALSKQNKILIEARDILLPRLMNGEIEV